jgi:hypothetical protein
MKARPDFSLVASTAIALATFAPAAFAYLDPSTGSMILSAIVGILATAGLVVKNYWYKLKSFFRGAKQTQPDSVTESASASVKDTQSDGE